MNFMYSAFTENTPELREWLENIGIRHNLLDTELETNEWIIANYGMYLSINPVPIEYVSDIHKDDINCLGNSDLFKAVTALRHDSDYMQWFICKISYREDINDIWHFCERPSIDEDSKFFGFISFRKATLEELKEKFKPVPTKI